MNVEKSSDHTGNDKKSFSESETNETATTENVSDSNGTAGVGAAIFTIMLTYGKEVSNRKQEIDRQHYIISI